MPPTTTTTDDAKAAARVPQLGRRRRASGISQMIGHMNTYEKGPLPLLVVTVLELETDPGVDVARRETIKRAGAIPRFRSRLLAHEGYFEEVELDPDYHFVVHGADHPVTCGAQRARARPEQVAVRREPSGVAHAVRSQACA